MNVSVWDTYVQKADGTRMHFDILVPDTITDATIVFNYGKSYLEGKPVLNTSLTRIMH